MTAAVRHIEKHYREKLELETFARAVSVSPAYLERTFRQFTGATPFEYLTRYRINQALALLKQPELNISQISFRVGYQDPLYFGKVFRQFTGHAPRQYRDKFLTRRQDIFF
jgi:YesN/AraC family two-component response regulator